MPDTTPTPAESAVVPPVAPVVPPVAPPAPEPKKSSLLSNILGLVDPKEVDVRPAPVVEPVKPAPVEPVAAAPVEPAAKPVPVRRKEIPAGPSAEEVRRIAAEEAAKAARPVVSAPAPVAPDDSDLTAEEKEELAVAKLAEEKDPSRKGLSDKFRSYYKAQSQFLEGRMNAEGDGYDPDQDPEFKRFVAKNAPKLPPSERKALREEQIAATAEARALKAADERYAPELEKLRTKTLELEHRPQIKERLGRYTGEIASGMPDDIVKFYNENGRDVAKTREAFPGEFDIVVQSVNGAAALAEEALALRRGLKKFDVADGKHQYLDKFLDRQATVLLGRPAAERMRDGKTFVHPYEFKSENAATTWSFDDEDVLGMIKDEAQKEAKTRVSNRRLEIKAAHEATVRRSVAPVGAPATPPVAPVVAPSTRTPPVVAPGSAAPAAKTGSLLSSLLRL